MAAYRSAFDAGAMRSEFEMAGIKTTFIPYIWKRLLQDPNNLSNHNPASEFDWEQAVPSLPSASYSLLRSKFKPLTSTVHSVVDSADQVTTKLLVKLQSGAFVEAVIMKYDTRLGKYGGEPRPGGLRSTLCISSQVGCKMGCRFCATGTMGYKSNLTSGEIVEQLVHASRFSQIRNIVFMGMGEPLNNYSSLVEAVRAMIGSPFLISPKRITISTALAENPQFPSTFQRNYIVDENVINTFLLFFTRSSAHISKDRVKFEIFRSIHLLAVTFQIPQVGIIHAINKLHGDLPGLNLAVSLHAPVQDIRCQIMPAARAFPLQKLMDALQEYQRKSQQKIFIEYIMLDGVNDEEQHIHQLGKLLETFQVVVNLIPFNPIGSSSQFRTSSDEKVSIFQKVLRGTYNIRTTVRKQMGQDISGACGQLVVSLPNKSSDKQTNVLPDIEDLHL